MAPPTVGWHEPQAFTPPPVPGLAPGAPLDGGESAADGAAGGTKKSFSAAELDHVPRYIAPEDDQPGLVSSPAQPRPVSAEWQPNELASFSGAEWVPPALAYEEVAAYVAPKAVSTEPPRSPRNLIIAVAGVALVAGLGFGVNKALAPDNAKVVVETTTVETTVKAATTVSTVGVSPVATRPATRAPGIVGAANAAGAAEAAAAAAADSAVVEEPATTTPAP
jgi:hypothetical protein